MRSCLSPRLDLEWLLLLDLDDARSATLVDEFDAKVSAARDQQRHSARG